MNVAVAGYSLSSAFFLILALVLLAGRRGSPQKAMLLYAAIISSLWAGSAAYNVYLENSLFVTSILELARDLAWIGFVLRVLTAAYSDEALGLRRFLLAFSAFTVATVLLVGCIAFEFITVQRLAVFGNINLLVGGKLLMAVASLVLLEQLFRNSRRESRRGIKYVCMGLGAMFAYDFYLYSDALLFQRIDPVVWQARGFVSALVVPVLGIAVARDPKWSMDFIVSRRIVFHTAALLAAGIYLLAMGLGGYYVREYGGEWGGVAQIIFLFGAALVLLIFMFSDQLRANLRVLISKHFFSYKYDYRDEWLRFTRTLSVGQTGAEVRKCAIQAVAEIIEGTGGILWMRSGHGGYEPVARWNMDDPVPSNEPGNSSLARFLEKQEWVINLDEYDQSPRLYSELTLPDWLRTVTRAWLVTPLIFKDRLLGFMVLARSPARHHFNWEDCDLLKTAGRQAASQLAQIEADEALADARQFEVCNRLSAYIVHDLKNLIAQLSLVVSNAAKHRHNPEFMEDAIRTVGNSVSKMNRLLQRLRSGGVDDRPLQYVDLCNVLGEVVEGMSAGLPVPKLDCQAKSVGIRADRDRFAAVISHLVQNAQEATPDHGSVIVRLFKSTDQAVVEVQDNGIGMAAEFISDRLFRPFDTTKGDSGMGIGVYEAREFVRELGGDISVLSRPHEGSTFRIRLPLAEEPETVQSEIVDQTRTLDGNRFKEIAGS
ncbi:MAG: XrtA/PEP-CTERM system histidine kinase PrsK [Gammaproteobacteria bacterium]